MKTWQKIVGVTFFIIITVIEMLNWANAYVDIKYQIEPFKNNTIIEYVYLRVGALSTLMWFNYVIALILFIRLWRKGGKR